METATAPRPDTFTTTCRRRNCGKTFTKETLAQAISARNMHETVVHGKRGAKMRTRAKARVNLMRKRYTRRVTKTALQDVMGVRNQKSITTTLPIITGTYRASVLALIEQAKNRVETFRSQRLSANKDFPALTEATEALDHAKVLLTREKP